MKYFLLLLIFFASALFSIDFDTSMKPSSEYNPAKAMQSRGWRYYHNLFNRFQADQQRINLLKAPYIIPKIVHMIWLGPPMPMFAKKMFESWKKFHPDWEVWMWRDNDVSSFPMQNREAYDRAHNFGEKSDILRYEILYKYGGVYVDTDFECLQSFDSICKLTDFFVGTGYWSFPGVSNAIIGSRPGHPVIKKCIQRIKVSKGDDSFSRILKDTGPLLLTKCLLQYLKMLDHQRPLWKFPAWSKKDIPLVLPVTFLFPLPDSARRDYMNIKDCKRVWVKPESLAIHYWTISWQGIDMISNLK